MNRCTWTNDRLLTRPNPSLRFLGHHRRDAASREVEALFYSRTFIRWAIFDRRRLAKTRASCNYEIWNFEASVARFWESATSLFLPFLIFDRGGSKKLGCVLFEWYFRYSFLFFFGTWNSHFCNFKLRDIENWGEFQFRISISFCGFFFFFFSLKFNI